MQQEMAADRSDRAALLKTVRAAALRPIGALGGHPRLCLARASQRIVMVSGAAQLVQGPRPACHLWAARPCRRSNGPGGGAGERARSACGTRRRIAESSQEVERATVAVAPQTPPSPDGSIHPAQPVHRPPRGGCRCYRGPVPSCAWSTRPPEVDRSAACGGTRWPTSSSGRAPSVEGSRPARPCGGRTMGPSSTPASLPS